MRIKLLKSLIKKTCSFHKYSFKNLLKFNIFKGCLNIFSREKNKNNKEKEKEKNLKNKKDEYLHTHLFAAFYLNPISFTNSHIFQ